MQKVIEAETAGLAKFVSYREVAKQNAKAAFKPCAGQAEDEQIKPLLANPSANSEELRQTIQKISKEALSACNNQYHDPAVREVFDRILSSKKQSGAHGAACETFSMNRSGSRENAKIGGTCAGAALSCTTALLKIKNECERSGGTACASLGQDLNSGIAACKNQYQNARGHIQDAARFGDDSIKAADVAKKSGKGECPSPDETGLPGKPGKEGDSGGGGSETAGSPGGGSQDPQAQGAQPGSGMGGMNPMSMLGPLMQAMGKGNQGQEQQQMPQQEPFQQPMDAVDCSVNPNLAGCPQAPKNDSWNRPAGDLSANEPDGQNGPFNLGSPSGGDGSAVESMSERSFAPAMTTNGIPNGGGGMPGGGGGGAASLGGSGGGGGGGGNAGSKADILHGERSGGGGYSAMAANMNMQSGEGGGGYSYGSGGDSSGYDDLDLRQFLPGGKQDPSRRLAGLGGRPHSEILSREVVIWNRVSDRIRARCLQGRLLDCGAP